MYTITERSRALWRERRDDIVMVAAGVGLAACLASVALPPDAAAAIGKTTFWLVSAALLVLLSLKVFAARRQIVFGVLFFVKALLWLVAVALAVGGILDVARMPTHTVLLFAILMFLIAARRW
jgi:hypothetical protein